MVHNFTLGSLLLPTLIFVLFFVLVMEDTNQNHDTCALFEILSAHLCLEHFNCFLLVDLCCNVE